MNETKLYASATLELKSLWQLASLPPALKFTKNIKRLKWV